MSAPTVANWDMAKHNGIQAFADELGVEYLDLNLLNNAVGIDWSTDTRDKGDHVNLAGAIKVTRYVGWYLSKRYHLPDRRKDEAYASWNDSLKRYKKYLASLSDKNQKSASS